MQFEFVYGKNQADLNEKVEKKIVEGWERYTGEVHTIVSGITSDNVEVPNFVYFSQSIIKEN
jgi:hypothetical protein